MRSLRLVKILRVALKYGLDEFLLGHERFHWLRPTARARHVLARRLGAARRAASSRAAGSRPDLRQVRPDAVDTARPAAEPTSPTSWPSCRTRCRRFLQRPGDGDTASASTQSRWTGYSNRSIASPVASASVAQVHLAELPDGTPAAVKILRPTIAATIDKDLGLMQMGAMLMEKLWSDGKRLRRAKSWPNSNARFTTSSICRARRQIARSCAAISRTLRCCSCPRCTGTGATAKSW